MIPKKRPADERGGDRAAKVPSRRRRHLYLVLDDWEKGYSIRKLDLSSDSDSNDDGHMSKIEQRLPPAVFRLEAPRGLSGLFTTLGTKIVATHHTPRRSIPMWDVSTRALTFAPRHKVQPDPFCNAYVEVDGILIFLDCGHFEMLAPPPPRREELLGGYIKVIWKWVSLPKPPFRHSVVAHAVHPDKQTIFFTTEKQSQKSTKVATFSFDCQSCKWNRHGDWGLPFKGRGYFDPELDAWIGLSGEPGTLGHLCACEVVSTDADCGQAQPMVWKLSKDKLFCVDPIEKHVGATLVYMEGRSSFCLVQCFSIDDREDDIYQEIMREKVHYLLRVTTFSLKYDRNGDLRTAANRRARSYRLSKSAIGNYDHLKKPVAFWI